VISSVTGASAATVVLRLPPNAAHVRTARLVAAAMARRSGVEEALLDEVRLAVGEACARAVRLHERHGVEEPVTVEFVERDRFAVAVIDRAPVQVTFASLTATSGDGTDADGPTDADTSTRAPWTDPTGDALGLALLDAVVQDLSVTEGDAGAGSRVSMSWPLGA